MDSFETTTPGVDSVIPRPPEILPATIAEAEAQRSALEFTPVSVAWRHDGWTPEKQRGFIEALADCGIVREAAARVGMTAQSAYGLRRRPDAEAFNRAWEAAVQLGVDQLHSTAFERAVAGTVKQRWYKGEVVGEERIFDNRLLMFLLARLDRNRDSLVERTIGCWDRAMDVVEDGFSEPPPAVKGNPTTPVWRDPDGEWLTDFVPPDDFEVDQWGTPGAEDYCRRLSPDELAAVEAWQAHLGHQARHRRERYFARLKSKVDPELYSTSS
jgi:hypothetical protein